MSAESFSMGRKCSVCGAPITDDNPDGIGCTCREVWYRARNAAFWHFCGLDAWIAKSNYWAQLFVDTCRTTKFRSAFRRSFFESVSRMIAENNVRLSKKMLSIITSYLIGDELDLAYGTAHPKFIGEDNQRARDGEKVIIDEMRYRWLANLNGEHIEYINNLAKKFYSESRVEVAA